MREHRARLPVLRMRSFCIMRPPVPSCVKSLRGRATGGAAARTASSLLATIAYATPLIGLLGTLLGLLVAFQQIAAHSGYATATDIASGVYESSYFDRIAGSGDSGVRCLQLSLGA